MACFIILVFSDYIGLYDRMHDCGIPPHHADKLSRRKHIHLLVYFYNTGKNIVVFLFIAYIRLFFLNFDR